MFNRFVFATMILLFSLTASANTIYTVQRGDTLIRVLKRATAKPVYGPKGALALTLALNRNIEKTAGNLIYPGQKIILPIGNVPITNETAEQPNVTRTPAIEVLAIGSDTAISLGVGINYSRFDVDDQVYNKSLQVISDLNWGFNLGYRVNWRQNFQIILNGNLNHYSFKNFDSSASFRNQAGNLVGFGFAVDYSEYKNLRPSFGVDLQERLFFKGLSSASFEVDSIPIIEPSIGLDYDFFSSDRFSLSSNVLYRYGLSTSAQGFEIKSGNRLSVSLSLTERFNSNQDSSLQFKLGYETGRQNSNFANQSSKVISLGTEIIWGL